MPIGFKAVFNGRETEIDDLLIKREFFGDGGLYSWGNNNAGQLGDGTTTDRTSPGSTAAGLGLNWKDIAVAKDPFNNTRTSLAIKTDGTLWTWGQNSTGQLGTGDTTSRSSPGTTAGGGTNWKQIDFGEMHAVALKTDGTLWTWGLNSSGQLGTGDTTARSSPGTTAGGGTNWKQVSCGYKTSAAIKTDGTLWTWGDNYRGKLGIDNTFNRSSPGTTIGAGTNWKEVSCGHTHAAAIKTDGTLWIWGRNNLGQLGTGDTTSRLSPITTSGGGTNWKQIKCGYNTTGAIKTDGTLWTWGRDAYGSLGAGTDGVSRSSPGTTAGGGTNWKFVEMAKARPSSCGIKTDGTLWTWGFNGAGNLGTGNTTNRSSPGTTVGGITNWKKVESNALFFAYCLGITDLTI
jgi:alpha-tubulin suppressor-like RCC1 family protein